MKKFVIAMQETAKSNDNLTFMSLCCIILLLQFVVRARGGHHMAHFIETLQLVGANGTTVTAENFPSFFLLVGIAFAFLAFLAGKES